MRGELRTPEEVIADLAKKDVVISILNTAEMAMIQVAYIEWIDAHRIYFFELGGETAFHGHVLAFDHATVIHSQGVELFDGEGAGIAYVTVLEEEFLPDEAERRAQYAQWKEYIKKAPEMTEFIFQVRDTLTETTKGNE